MQRHHVASGTFYHGKKQATILNACLGTCVGVTLFDKEADVGGLIHLLLPEPITLESTFQPEKYASNGLPLFLNALFEAGASKHNLRAWIAGGALVGPIMQRDLDLDIGGRTAEVARNILAGEGIAIEQVETGGFFACSLSLDMQTWRCAIEPIGFDRSQQAGEIATLTETETLRAIAAVQPIPQIALKILRLMSGDDFDVSRVAEEVRQDQVISALTLKICNSAIFARKRRIDSLDHALVYLGRDLFLKLVITATISGLYESSQAGYSLCKGGLFHHAVGTATIAEKIAAVTGLAEPSLAYTGGLLHDIGKVVLDQHLAKAFPLFYRQSQDHGVSFMATEKEVFGMTHCDTGYRLAQNWSFPDSLMTVIRHHHYPEAATDYTQLTHIVYLADLLMSRFHTGLEIERINTETLIGRLEAINLPPARFQEIVDLIPSSVFETENRPDLTE
jgi:putative nucleotidyltransferase with HDIG domain